MNAVLRDRADLRAVPTPRAQEADAARESNLGWELDRAAIAARSARRAWWVAAFASVLAALAIAAVFALGPLRRVETVALVVDKLNGETSVLTKLEAATVPSVEALDMHNATRFVRAREAYNWMFLQKDYDTVIRMATPGVFTEYNKQFDGTDSLDKRLGSLGEYRVNVTNVRLPPTSRTGNVGEAVVTFEKEIRLPNKTDFEVQRFVATLRFEYRPKMLQKKIDQIENPFGFVVTAYRADVEIVNKKPAAPPAAT